MMELNVVKQCIWGFLLHVTKVGNVSSIADNSLGHEQEIDRKRQKDAFA